MQFFIYYYIMARLITINDFVVEMGKTLNIDVRDLNNLINTRLTVEERNLNDYHRTEISKLLNVDLKINKYGEINQINKTKYDELKSSLGNLQLNVLLKKLKNANDCTDVIRSFSNVINNKLDVVNDIIIKNMTGGIINYYNKYIKYKNKYLTYKYNGNTTR